MNIVASYVPPGLRQWKATEARVTAIPAGEWSVPRIQLAVSDMPLQGTVMLLSGLHLEETSGPILLSQPDRVLPLVKPIIVAGYRLLIYPQVNQWGAQFSEASNHILLRCDVNRRNYNDGWGNPDPKRKPAEVAAVEADILSLHRRHPIKFAMTLHEDSVSPKMAYIWANKVSDGQRRKLVTQIRRRWPYPDQLLTSSPEVGSSEKMEDFLAVDQRDPGALEEWLAYSLGVPTLTIEAPYSDTLPKRMQFHTVVIEAAGRAGLYPRKVDTGFRR